MKKRLYLYTSLVLFVFFFSIHTNAQRSIFPPLGIEWPDIPLKGNPGSNVYSRGIQSIARTKIKFGEYPENADATRFLEKAVKENNLENAAKFLKAGASAFISYEMIDNKQYEMIDLMYKDNPKLIRYSQLLHYACAKSDSTMIDFLIERKASLDLNGYYLKYGDTSTPMRQGYNVMCMWNRDPKYKYTPADVAFNWSWTNLKYIIKKYHKYPTIYGFSQALAEFLMIEKANNPFLKNLYKVINGENDLCNNILENVDYTIKDVINFGYHYLKQEEGDASSYYLMNEVVSKIAASRKANDNRDKEYIDLLTLMIDKGADVNCEKDNGAGWRVRKSNGITAGGYTNTTPMYIALTNKNMLDIVKLLRSKGASLTTTVNGRKVSILKLPNVLDEYKEYFILEGVTES